MEVTNKEKAVMTYKEIQKRKAARKKGARDADMHLIENCEKIRKFNNRRKKGRCYY